MDAGPKPSRTPDHALPPRRVIQMYINTGLVQPTNELAVPAPSPWPVLVSREFGRRKV